MVMEVAVETKEEIMQTICSKNLKNKSGFSVVDALIAAGFVAAAGIMAMGLVSTFNVNVSRSSTKKMSSYFHTDLLARSKRVLMQVEDTSTPPRLVNGLCHSSLIRSDSQVAGVSLIQTNIRAETFNEVFTSATWEQIFGSDWSAIGCPASISDGAYSARCFRLKNSSALAATIAKDDVLDAYVKVIPVGVDPKLSSGFFNPLANDIGWIDAKKVAYGIHLMVKHEYADPAKPAEKKTDESISNGMVWVAEIPYCDSGSLKLSMSGTGLGDWLGNSIYNTASFDEQSIGPLLISTHKRVVTKGKLFRASTDGADYIAADFSKNIELACTETAYRCPGVGGRTFLPNLGLRTNVSYFANNNVNAQVQSRFSLRPRIISPQGTDIITDRVNSIQYRAAGQEFREDANGHMFQLTEGGNMSTSEFYVGGNLARTSVDVTFTNGAGMCQTICSNASQKYKMNFLATLWGFNRDGSDYTEVLPAGTATDPDINVGCNVCNSKSCNKMGLEVFGDMSSQPPEPLDAGVPYCAVADSSRSQQVYKPTGSPAITSNSCLSYKQTSSGGVLSWKNCSTALPVICFNNGSFAPARQFSNSTRFYFPAVMFNQAQDLCYQQSVEKGSVATLKELFNTYVVDAASRNVSISAINKMSAGAPNYIFYNNTNQGLFIAPQTSTQWSQLASGLTNPKVVYADSQYPDVSDKEFWIAMRSSADGSPTPIPEVPVAKAGGSNAYNYALYWGRDGRPLFREITNSVSDAGSSGVGVLVYHLKYRGLVFSNSSFATRRALCRSKSLDGDYFLTGSVTTSASASTACESNGGVFAAPTTPLGWAKAFDLLVTGFDVGADQDVFTFPDPSGAIKSVWVALSGSSGGDTSSFTVPASHTKMQNLNENSELTTGSPKQQCDKYDADMEAWQEAMAAWNTAVAAYDSCTSCVCAPAPAPCGCPSCSSPGPAPVEPAHPAFVCGVVSVERYADGKVFAQRYDQTNKVAKISANKVICKDTTTGKWTAEAYSATNLCPGKAMVTNSELTSSYINSTKWLMIQSTLSSSDIIYFGN